MPRTAAALVQGQTEPQSTIPGVNTSSNPKTQVATIAGFMIARSNRRSIDWNIASVSDPGATAST